MALHNTSNKTQLTNPRLDCGFKEMQVHQLKHMG